MEKMERLNDTVIVGVDFSSGDTGVLIVGRKDPKNSVEIINAFQGDEAKELYLKLVTPVKKV